MSREKKFKAWDKKEKKWFAEGNTFNLDYSGKYGVFLFDNDNWDMDGKDLEWVEFVGENDKHGKEVFEGDVVQPYSSGLKYDLAIIRYIDHSFCMAWPEDKHSMDCIWYFDFEVVGNIYENPELLKENPHD